MGRGEAPPLRVVQRLREGRDEAAHPRLRPGRGRAQLQGRQRRLLDGDSAGKGTLGQSRHWNCPSGHHFDHGRGD